MTSIGILYTDRKSFWSSQYRKSIRTYKGILKPLLETKIFRMSCAEGPYKIFHLSLKGIPTMHFGSQRHTKNNFPILHKFLFSVLI